MGVWHMKKNILTVFIISLIFTMVFTQTDWEKKIYGNISWQQPETWEKFDEPTMPGIAYFHGTLIDGNQLEDGAIFAIVSDSAFAENTLKEMKKDTDTTIRVQKVDIVNGIKREFYEGTLYKLN
jgi:hypothetical protein